MPADHGLRIQKSPHGKRFFGLSMNRGIEHICCRPFRLAVPQWFHHGSVSTSRSSNRTGRFPASGLYGAFFVKAASRHFCLPLSFHSFVRPAPRTFFRPDRIFPPPSRVAAVKEALLQRRRRLVLDGREHGGRLPAIGCWPRDDPRGACHWPRSIARTTLVFG